MRSPLLLVAMAALVPACAMNVYDHQTVATVGFASTPRVVLLEITGDPGLAEAARREVLAASKPEVVDVKRVTLPDDEAPWGDLAQAACRREVLELPDPPPAVVTTAVAETGTDTGAAAAPDAGPGPDPAADAGAGTQGETGVAPGPVPESVPAAGPIPAAGPATPVDLILVIQTRSSAQSYDRCPVLNRRLKVRAGTGTTSLDPSSDDLVVRTGTPGGLDWTCTEFEYSHTMGVASASVTRLNPDCTHHDGDAIPARHEVRVASNDKVADGVRARAAARQQTVAGPLRRLAHDLLPRGLRVARQDGPRVELEGAASLVGDNPFRIAARRGDGRTSATFIIDRATPSSLAGEVFNLERLNGEDDALRTKVPFQLRLGDQVQRRAYSHELKLMPLVSVGSVRADGGETSTALAAVASLRWHYPRLFTAAEAAYSHGLEFGQDSRRREGTLALGPTLTLRAFRLRGYGEAGLVSLRRTEPMTRTALETQFGAGVGVDVWIRKEVITLDLRHRWSTALRAVDSAAPPAIEDATVWLVQLGYAFRIDQPKGEPALPKVGSATPR